MNLVVRGFLSLLIVAALTASSGISRAAPVGDQDVVERAGQTMGAAPGVGDLVAIDAAIAAGIFEVTQSWGAWIGDFNADQWPDILMPRHYSNTARLYRNVGGFFTEVNADSFPTTDRHDCAWGDVNADGLLDAYCTVGAYHGVAAKPNELWIQRADRSFVNHAVAYGVEDVYGRGRAVSFIDVNHDVYPDLFVGNAHPRKDTFPSPNRLFINQGGSSFREAPEYGLNVEVGGLCADPGDYNNDGWQDLLVCTGAEQSPTGLKLYRNDEGQSFTDVTDSVNLSGQAAAAILTHLDGDGLLDVVQLSPTQVVVRLQRSGGFQTVVTRSLTYGADVAAGDVDGDDRADLYIATGGVPNQPDVMLVNDGSGTSFTDVAIPQTTAGSGEAVAALDYNRNGMDDFVVMNGWHNTKGPVQLISFFRCTTAGTTDSDRIAGTSGSDVICGGQGGSDTIDAREGHDIVIGNESSGQTNGGPGNDVLFGGGGSDTLLGGFGKDTLVGGPGNDVENGEAGNDAYDQGQAADGSDKVGTANGADTGTDTVFYEARVNSIRVSVGNTTADGESGEGDNVGADVESVRGGYGSDSITGDPSNESLLGGLGNDTIRGQLGNDLLLGGFGADTVNGGSGNDKIDEEGFDNGADGFTGGTGTDTVDYSSRSVPVFVTRDGLANDGRQGEADNVRADVEQALLPLVPTRLSLTPTNSTAEIGTSSAVTAAVVDRNGNAMQDVPVWFTVSGANQARAGVVTNASGQATFAYEGSNPGDDTINAYADTSRDARRQSWEPQAVATRKWTG